MHPEPGSKRSWLSYNDVSKRLINRGGMCERLKQAVLKTAIPERVSGVRIPLPPPNTSWVGNYLAASTVLPGCNRAGSVIAGTIFMDVLKELFEQHFHSPVEQVQPLHGQLGGSGRNIIRLAGEKSSAIGVLYAVHEENLAFLEFSRHFRRHGLPV